MSDALTKDLSVAPNKAHEAPPPPFDYSEWDEPTDFADPVGGPDAGAAPDGPAPAAENITDSADTEGLAEMIVEGLQYVRTDMLAPYFQKSVYSTIDSTVMISMMRKIEENNTKFTEAERAAAKRARTVKEYEEKAPYTEEQKNKYISRIAGFLGEMGWNVQMPPWLKLTITAVTIEAPMLLPIFGARKMKFISEPKNEADE